MCYNRGMRKSFLVLALLATSVASVSPVFATSLSEEQRGAISQNCNSIKTSLSSLQKSDSKVRVLLGTSYQTILSNFLTPLNIRLVKNNATDATLSSIQTNLASERNTFQEQFIRYSKSLENLIAIDCKNNPDEFYKNLDETRTLRSALNKTAVRIHKLIDKHLSIVRELKGEKR